MSILSKKIAGWGVATSVAVLLGSACSSSERGYEGTQQDSGVGGNFDATTQDSGLGACAAETHSAKQLPLDIFVVLDASGSMNQLAEGTTRWDGVTGALGAFLTDPQSAGIGVGLQTFPIVHEGAPETCASNAECTAGATSFGRCFLKACVPTDDSPVVSCDSSADCGGAECLPLGQCYAETGNLPPMPGICFIGGGTACPLSTVCRQFTERYCEQASCFVEDYAKPRVPIAALPANAAKIQTTIASMPPPLGRSPASMALKGGLQYAQDFAAAHSNHVVVVVLATDGQPTECAPLDAAGIASIAKAGASGTPTIRTFVIGVYTNELETAFLDTLAHAGGTSKALRITPESDIRAEFQASLAAIRRQALPCEYDIPKPTVGVADYGKVNVQWSPGTGSSSLFGYKQNVAACGAAGGWYYDVDPALGTSPTKIVLCPSSCGEVKATTASSAKVEVLLGCKSVVN